MPLAIKIKQGKIVTYIKIWWKEITMTHKKEKNKWKKSEKDTTNCQILWHTFLQSFQNLVNHINSHFIRMLAIITQSKLCTNTKLISQHLTHYSKVQTQHIIQTQHNTKKCNH